MVEERDDVSSLHTTCFHSVHAVCKGHARSHNHVPRKKKQDSFGARTARLRRAKVTGELPHSLEQTQMFSGAKLVTRTGASRNPPAQNADSKAVS